MMQSLLGRRVRAVLTASGREYSLEGDVTEVYDQLVLLKNVTMGRGGERSPDQVVNTKSSDFARFEVLE